MGRTSMKLWKAFAAFVVLSAPTAVQAVVIVETFESFATGTIITNQLTGLTVTALNGGNANIATHCKALERSNQE